jgi:hypothetical protein
MTWADDIGACLQTNGIGTLGTDIFYEDFDPIATNCIALITQTGPGPKITLRKTMTLKRPELGVRVRNQDKVTAYSKIESICDLLSFTVNTTIGNTRFKAIKPIGEPFFVSQSKNDTYIYSMNFSLEISK